MNSNNSPRRPTKIFRYKPSSNKPGDDPTADYLNLMGMFFSMCGLMMRVSSIMVFLMSFGFTPKSKYTLFFVSKAFVQLSLSVACIFNELSLKCCLSVAC